MLKQIILVLSASAMFAYSFPSQTIVEYKNSKFPKTDDKVSSKSVDQPLLVIVEENDTKSGSVIVQFVYNGNDNEKRKGADAEKYILKNSSSNPILDAKEAKQDHGAKIENKQKESNTNLKEEKKKSFEAQRKMSNKEATQWLFGKPETSPLQESRKFFYDVFNPIPPFPELMEKDFKKDNLRTFKAKDVSTLSDKKYQSPNRADPQLYPRTIYNTEFDVPFF